jgi:adenylate cyclase
MAARNAEVPEERKMLLRIGINVGDVMVKDEDIFGDGVNVAARLQALAVPGGICISRAVRDQLRDKSPFVFEDQGEQAVKNIARPVRVFTVHFEGAPKTTASIVVDPLDAEIAPAATSDDARAGKADETELAFWESITDSEAASDYSAYLARYPTGNFSALARARLIGLTTGNSVGTADEVKLEITYWESVKESEDTGIIRSYLEKYPDGHFQELAEARMEQLRYEKEKEG